MRIWFDGQCLQTASRVRGIGRYVYELLHALSQRNDVELLVSFNACLADATVFARRQIEHFIDRNNIHVWHGIAEGGEAIFGQTPKRRASEIALQHHVACLAPDVAVSASPFEGLQDPAVPLLAFPAMPSRLAALCYDFIPARFPDHYLTDAATQAAYDRRLRAQGSIPTLLAISAFSASEARARFPQSTVHTIGTGLSDLFRPQPRERHEAARQTLPLIVRYIGSLDWRKNASVIARAFAALPSSKRQRFRLEIAGAYVRKDVDTFRDLWRDLRLPMDQLGLLGTVSDAELVELYQSADVVVQPSRMEGFGMTALEAMACGAPVLAADAGALPEVVGEKCVLFNPDDAFSLASLLVRLEEQPEWREELSKAGIARATRFTWQGVAERFRAPLAHLPPHGRSIGDVAFLRRKALSHLVSGNLPGSLQRSSLAKLMSLAEPMEPLEPRLLVDMTATTRDDLRTGIQRVVRKMAANLPKTGIETVPFFCAAPNNLLCVDGNPDDPTSQLRCSDRPLDLRANDHVVLLDSSWADWLAHSQILKAARTIGAPTTVVIYDLIPIRAPAFCNWGMPAFYRTWLKNVLAHADNILCISRAVADDVYDLLKEVGFERRVRIGYWPLGADFSALPSPDAQATTQQPRGPTFLVVGTLEPRKGHRLIVKAFDALWKAGVQARLQIAGKKGWHMDFFAQTLRQHPESGSRLEWIDQPDDDRLTELYAASDAVIVASYAEGFGLPLIEAAHFGKHILASDIPVFREIAAGVPDITFFPPGSATALEQAVRSIITSSTLQTNEKPSRPHITSWSESANAMKGVLSSGTWYRTFEPARTAAAIPNMPLPIQSLSLLTSLDTDDVDLELTEGPTYLTGTRLLFIARVTNCSGKPLTGHSDREPSRSIALGARLFDSDGRSVRADMSAQNIPLTIGPGRSIFLGSEIALPSERFRGHVELRLWQDETGWWGPTLKVPI